MTTNAKNTKPKGARKVSFDKKRAARFESRGVRVDNIVPDKVAIGLDGHSEEGENCSLCDHDIQWLYILHLELTDGKAVTFSPVGSSCIQTWADSLPISAAQAAIVAALKLANDKVESIKASIREFNRQAAAGAIENSDRDALVKFLSSPPRIRENEFLADVAAKVEKFGGWRSDKQRDAWLNALSREFAKVNRPTTPAAKAQLSADDEVLIERAQALIANPKFASLPKDDHDAIEDIAAKVVRFGSFASPRQSNFLAILLRRGEAIVDQAPARVVATDHPRPEVADAEAADEKNNLFGGTKKGTEARERYVEGRNDEDYDGELPF